jgi:predicted MFS family arabinose efflux permease
LGALSSTLGMAALVYGIVRSADFGWADPFTILSLMIGLLLLGLLVLNEWRARQPIMPLRLFASRERAGAYVARILYLGAMLGFWFFITQYLQTVKGYSPIEAGIAFLPMTICNFIVAVLVPRLTWRFGNARLLAGGIAMTLIGMFWLSRLTADGSYLTSVALPMVLLGIGQGASLGPLTAAGIAGVTPKDAGAASGLVNVAHQLGGSLGLGILVTIFAAAHASALNGGNLLTHRISVSLTAGTIMLALAFIVVVMLIVRSLMAVKSSSQ